jgi:membrane-bound lytic murein transglycosylase A
MKEVGRMWLLLPRELRLGSGTGVLTRGAAGAAEADCVVPDPELCVE